MKVNELIKLLIEHDMNKEVVYRQCSDTWGSIGYVYEEVDTQDPDKPFCVVLE